MSRSRRAARPPPTVADLPDEVLINVLGHLELGERYGGQRGACSMQGGGGSGAAAPPVLPLLTVQASLLLPSRRHRTASLVCRRWRQLADSPPLLRSLWSLCEWVLLRAAGHVQHLQLQLDPSEHLPANRGMELPALLVGMLAACGAAGEGLSSLDLSLGSAGMEISSWAVALRGLTQLRLACGDMDISSSLAALTRLQDLELNLDYHTYPTVISMGPAVRLPTSITRLVLASDCGRKMPPQVRIRQRGCTHPGCGAIPMLHSTVQQREGCIHCQACPALLEFLHVRRVAVPGICHTLCPSTAPAAPQVAALTGLVELRLYRIDYSSDGYAPLTRLQGLRRLQLSWALLLPDCLPQLTQLTALEIRYDPGDHAVGSESDVVEATLQQLSQLQHLALGPNIPGVDSPPAALAHLPALRSLYWRQGSTQLDFPVLPALPGGTWLASLRCLVAPAHILACSLPALAAAQQLEILGVECRQGDEVATLAVIRWGARRPSLRHLLLQVAGPGMPLEVWGAVLEAQRCCPALRITPCHDACVAAAAIEPGLPCWCSTDFD